MLIVCVCYYQSIGVKEYIWLFFFWNTCCFLFFSHIYIYLYVYVYIYIYIGKFIIPN